MMFLVPLLLSLLAAGLPPGLVAAGLMAGKDNGAGKPVEQPCTHKEADKTGDIVHTDDQKEAARPSSKDMPAHQRHVVLLTLQPPGKPQLPPFSEDPLMGKPLPLVAQVY